MVYFTECIFNYLGLVISPNEDFRHLPTLVGECLLVATDPFESKELAIGYAIPAVARVGTPIVKVVVTVCRFAVQVCL